MKPHKIDFYHNNVRYQAKDHGGHYCNECEFSSNKGCTFPRDPELEAYSGICMTKNIVWQKDISTNGNKHAGLMLEYAKDSFENSTAYTNWECKDVHCEVWHQCNDHPRWLSHMEYRRKPISPKTCVVNDEEISSPCVKELKSGQNYWAVFQPVIEQRIWENTVHDRYLSQCGMVHLSKEDAMIHRDVLVQYNKMCCGL